MVHFAQVEEKSNKTLIIALVYGTSRAQSDVGVGLGIWSGFRRTCTTMIRSHSAITERETFCAKFGNVSVATSCVASVTLLCESRGYLDYRQ